MPKSIDPPNWVDAGEDEMSVCQKKFFTRWGERIHELPVSEVVKWFDCIGFMDVKDAANWLPVWMAASYFAEGHDDVASGNISESAMSALERCLESGYFFLPFETISQFAEDFGDTREVDPGFHAVLDRHRKTGDQENRTQST